MGQDSGTAGTPGRGLYTVRGMADALGISKSECHRDKQAGMPMHSVDAARAWRAQTHDVSRSAEGRIDRPQLFEHSAPDGAAPAAASGAGAIAVSLLPPPAIAPAAPLQAPDDQAEPGDTALYREERTKRETIRREREELELAQIKGKLIDVEEASRCAFTAFRSMRDAVMNVPARIKAELAAETDPFRVEQLLDAELGAALAGFNVAGAVRDTEQDEDEEP